MHRRGGGRQPVKGQRGDAIRPKAHKAPTTQVSSADLQKPLDQRTHELDEALEQQTATAEILKVISPVDFRPTNRQRSASLPRAYGRSAPVRW